MLLNYSAVPTIFPSMPGNKSPQTSTASENLISSISENLITNSPTTFAVSKNSIDNLPINNLFDSSIPSSLDLFEHSTCSTFNSIQTTESVTDKLLLKKDLKRKEVHQISTRSLLK